MVARKRGDLKSYIILFIIVIGTLVGVFYILNWYKQYNDSKLSIPVISSVLREVTYNDLETVVRERDFLVVYMCTASETKCRNFESKFKNYIKEENLSEDIVYLSLGTTSSDGEILKNVYEDFKSYDLIKKIYDYPTLLIFSEGKLVDLLSPSKDSQVSINSVREFLSGYEI